MLVPKLQLGNPRVSKLPLRGMYGCHLLLKWYGKLELGNKRRVASEAVVWEKADEGVLRK